MEEYVRSFNGKIIGKIEKSGDRLTIRSFHGEILGYYEFNTGYLRNFHGVRIAEGPEYIAGILLADQLNC